MLLQSIKDPGEEPTSAIVQALSKMSRAGSAASPAGWVPSVPQTVAWLGLVNAVGRLVHRMLVVSKEGRNAR